MSQDPIAKARELMAQTLDLAVGALNKAMSGLSDVDIKEGFAKAPKEAPLWAHAALNMATKAVKSETDKAGGGPASLKVILISKAESKEQWLEMAKPYQRPAIEAVATPTEPKK